MTDIDDEVRTQEKLKHFEKLQTSESKVEEVIDLNSISIEKVIRDLGLTLLKENCSICLTQIKNYKQFKSCETCSRIYHPYCLQPLIIASKSITLQPKTFQCSLCQQAKLCILCDTFCDSDSYYSCSICQRKMHKNCYIFSIDILKQLDNNKTESIVCTNCYKRWGVKEIVTTRVTKQQKISFNLLAINHPSPTHFLWMTSKTQHFDDESAICVDTDSQVQLIISLHIPKTHSCLSFPDFVTILRHSFEEISASSLKEIKLLVKWRGQGNFFVWQSLSKLKQWKQFIGNFMHLLGVSWIKTVVEPNNMSVQAQINRFIMDQSVFNQIKYIGSEVSEALKFQSQINEMLNKMYKIYAKGLSQSIKSKPQISWLKAEIITRLINSIYFMNKNSAPIVLLTSSSLANWWMNHFRSKMPYLTSVLLSTFTPLTVKFMTKELLKFKKDKVIFMFNVLVITFDNLEFVAKNIDVKHLLSCCSLLLTDDNMNQFAKYFFLSVSVPKIKMFRSREQTSFTRGSEDNSKSRSMQNSGNGIRNTMNIEDQINSNKPLRQRKTSKRTLFQKTVSILFKSFQLTRPKFQRQTLKESQRVAFLRFVLAFGVHCPNSQNLIAHLIETHPHTFINLKQESAFVRINAYILQFMAIISIFSQRQCVTKAEQQLIDFYCFETAPQLIKKRIILLTKLRSYYNYYSSDHTKMNPIKPPVIKIQGKLAVIRNWQSVLDLFICGAVLEKGIGKWKEISEFTCIWEEQAEEISFRDYISVKLQLNIDINIFQIFIQRRTEEIVNHIQGLMM